MSHPQDLADTIKRCVGMTKHEAAREYASNGFPVFPCQPDKSPYTRRGFKDATCDPSQIQRWWSQRPEANIGLPTGEPSGVVVVDVDTTNADDMAERINALQAEYGSLTTFTLVTPSGGQHRYFVRPPFSTKSSQGTLLVGVDTRSEGAYVLVPPSTVGGNGYRIAEDHPIVPFPERLAERLRRHGADELEPLQSQFSKGSNCSNCSNSHSVPLEWVLKETLPTGKGERNKQILRLARGLKYDCNLMDADLADLKPIVRQWHGVALDKIGTKSFDETWADFCHAWDRAECPLKASSPQVAFMLAKAELPPEAEAYDSQPVKLLVGLCWHMSGKQPGSPFFLSTYEAAPLLKQSQPQTHKHLMMLARDKVITILKHGDPIRRKANRYCWGPAPTPFTEALTRGAA